MDAQQRRQVTAALRRAEETLLARLQETYTWLIVPAQPEATGPIVYEAHRLVGQESFYERAARKLYQSELLIRRWSSDNLRHELDRYLWRDQPHVGVKQLWDYLARYCYLPRLPNEAVLLETIREGVARADAPFGWATSVDVEGVYQGLAFRSSAVVSFDDQGLVVRPEVAQAQLAQSMDGVGAEATPPPAAAAHGSAAAWAEPALRRMTRYHGTVALDPQRANREMATIVEEIVERLAGLKGVRVRLTLDISAERSSGFDEATMRTIDENSRTLKFSSHGFEGE